MEYLALTTKYKLFPWKVFWLLSLWFRGFKNVSGKHRKIASFLGFCHPWIAAKNCRMSKLLSDTKRKNLDEYSQKVSSSRKDIFLKCCLGSWTSNLCLSVNSGPHTWIRMLKYSKNLHISLHGLIQTGNIKTLKKKRNIQSFTEKLI